MWSVLTLFSLLQYFSFCFNQVKLALWCFSHLLHMTLVWQEALAYHYWAELFQVYYPNFIIFLLTFIEPFSASHFSSMPLNSSQGLSRGKLKVNSAETRLNGCCSLTPEEVWEHCLTLSCVQNLSVSVKWLGRIS